MALLRFTKWQGTGNDFILVDDRDGSCPEPTPDRVRRLCDRHYGIGSDGLILVRAPRVPEAAFHMEFLNPDGSRSFCGNGSRCAAAFHGQLVGAGPGSPVVFTAIDGLHKALLEEGHVVVGMRDVPAPVRIDDTTDLLDTGSPHVVRWVDDPGSIDLLRTGRQLRHDPRFAPGGVNVNFACWRNGHVEMRTYERGVEDETLSCGTGVTAAALSAMHRGLVTGRCGVITRGGGLEVTAAMGADGAFTDVHLAGPARPVFNGAIMLELP